MKIAIVSDAIYPYNKGGKEKRIYETTTRLARFGHEVHIYTMKWWAGENHRTENGVNLHAISSYYPLYAGKRRSIKEAVFFSLACLKLAFFDFDVIEVDHMPHLILFSLKIVCTLKRRKMYVTWNEVWGLEYWKKYLGKLSSLAYLVEKLSVQTPDIIIAVSNHTAEKLASVLKSKKSMVTIPNGIDLKSIEKVSSARQTSDIIFAGRLLAHKNIDLLINAIAIAKKSYSEIKCLIIGEGPEKNNLVKQVKEKKLTKNMLLFNFFNRPDDLYAHIKSSKIFILPSSREGFGIVVLEANACGIPVITVDHQDNAASDLIINGKNGLICKLDEKSLAKAILTLLENPLAKSDCVDAVKNYDWDTITKQIETVYQNL